MKDAVGKSSLGTALRALRRRNGWTLSEVSQRTGFSVPTLSRVENSHLSLSYEKLIRLSDGLDANIGELFVPAENRSSPGAGTPGRLTINRRGDGELTSSGNADFRHLSADVIGKRLIPLLVQVRARSLEEFGHLERRQGEEFIYVIAGEIEVCTDLCAPFALKAGESAHLSGCVGYACVAKCGRPCLLLVVRSSTSRGVGEPNGPSARTSSDCDAPFDAVQANDLPDHENEVGKEFLSE
jgi:transcriptional regulator with XRE-family HTH domain